MTTLVVVLLRRHRGRRSPCNILLTPVNIVLPAATEFQANPTHRLIINTLLLLRSFVFRSRAAVPYL